MGELALTMSTALLYDTYEHLFIYSGIHMLFFYQQSDNGLEFVATVISELVKSWPGTKIIRGRPRHPQSQGGVERGNQDLEDKLGMISC